MAATQENVGASASATITAGSGDEESGQFVFAPIQLTTVTEQRGMHQKNETPNEVQRPDVLDDKCLGLLMQARVDRIVHGRGGPEGPLATLVVFGFRFRGLHGDRRFKSATISVVFEDEQRRGSKHDPKVVSLWPNGNFTLGEPTVVQVEDTEGGEAGANVDIPAGAPVVTTGAHVVRSWEKKKAFGQKRSSKLTGSILLDFSVREHGPANAVELTLSEDDAGEYGITSELRAAVLLERKNDIDIFTAKVKMTGKVNFFYNLIRAVRDVTPFAPANDPVRFKPGVQYLRPPTGNTTLDGNIAAEIAEDELSSSKLGSLAGLLGINTLTAAT